MLNGMMVYRQEKIHKSAQSEKMNQKIAHSEIYCKIYKARTKCETHNVKPHKVRANCKNSIRIFFRSPDEFF